MRPYHEEVFARAARHIYKKKGFKASMLRDKPIRAAIEESYEVLRPALNKLSEETPEAVRSALEENTFVFSGFRTYHSLRELGLSLTTSEGKIRPFDAFREDVRKVHDRYNVNYLEAEYDHAVGSALMADRWLGQEASGDEYLLQYRTAGDNRVRPDHEALEGITLPKGDKFWSDYYPPNGWRCRCNVVEVLPEDYPVSDSTAARERGEATLRGNKQEVFRGNPGKDLRIFPEKHPYFGKGGIARCAVSRNAQGDDTGDACDVLKKILEVRELEEVQKKAREVAKVQRKKIPPFDGLRYEPEDKSSPHLIMLRRSLEDIREHAREDIAVQRWITAYDISNRYDFKYVGWAPCRTDSQGQRKHNEARYFSYYTLEIEGITYYVNARMHKQYDGAVIYSLEKDPPKDLREGQPDKKEKK
jgi:hypothetical protein|nr:MAG TPA: minor capsid component [Caudoviricetes sp.]